MREFCSYGPVDREEHFSVDRRELVQRCVSQLVGAPGKGGHYFTIWAPRQCGKTWLMREACAEIGRRSADQFLVATTSVEGMVIYDNDPAEAFLKRVPRWIAQTFDIDLPEEPPDWDSFQDIFSTKRGLFDRPVILAVDEFDKLPPHVIDRLVSAFRDMYLRRSAFCLHGLALIGVRAVLGVESRRGSPFNIQRSLHVPRFSEDEGTELFRQYQDESGQRVEPEVVAEVYRVTRGQPGLVCWFGELMAKDEYNPGVDRPIDLPVWRLVYCSACQVEWNNTVLNLVKKARAEGRERVLELFSTADLPFELDEEWCNYLYFNGIIDAERTTDDKGEPLYICRFSSPFVQQRLYNALTGDLVGDRTPILPLEILDDLADVFEGESLNAPALLERYKAYLTRLEAKGIDPWKEQPRRADLRLTEAVGHFHLYAWLQAAIGRRCIISPEFPTGNGKVDLHLRCGEKRAVIEVKSFVDLHELDKSRPRAAYYAATLGLARVTMALFVPTKDGDVLQKLSSETTVDDVQVNVVAIGWGDA